MPEGYSQRRAFRTIAAVLAVCLTAGSLALVWPMPSDGNSIQNKELVVETGQAVDGFVMVKYKKSSKTLKVRVSQGDHLDTYDQNGEGEYEVYPLLYGDGDYKVQLFQQASGNKYAAVASVSFDAALASEDAPFLCPNQYVWYTADSKAVALSNELCEGLTTTREKVDAVYQYIISHFQYHHIRALTVESGYLPDVDQMLEDGMGICFDFAALMACMLRVQGVPTRLVIGYADKGYHAWNMVKLEDGWQRYDPTSDVTQLKVKKYVEERMY